LADPLSIDEVEGERIDAETLAQARQAGTSDNPRIAAYLNFLNIFELEPGDTPVERLPLRGVRSTPAIVQGNPIGINLDNKFTLNPETSTFTVTVDNVTGLIQLPVGREFTKESFRRLLEDRINSLEDSRGRTVANVKVEYKTEGNITRLVVTTGTEGNDSFLKISGPSIWGLRDLPNGRGTTERWIAPPQAENDNGVPLYVDRDGNETTEAGEFSEEEARDLYAPIFLDKGELTFSNRGELVSPVVPINFKPATIEETGATLQFAINYNGTTQFSSPFGVLAQTQNGRPEGDLIGLDIADDGLVTAQYSNGSQNNLAKIILSNFTNPQGLRQIGDASYYATSKSGLITFGEPGRAGFGTVRSGARERANVDLTQELIDLITAQRAFQANAKAIETNNTLTQAIINIRS
jgi:flagellar hook-basal body protein